MIASPTIESFSPSSDCVFVGISGDNLKIKWTSNKDLEIWYPPETTVIRRSPTWNNVSITYDEDPDLQKY
jgi:hypothetical protein